MMAASQPRGAAAAAAGVVGGAVRGELAGAAKGVAAAVGGAGKAAKSTTIGDLMERLVAREDALEGEGGGGTTGGAGGRRRLLDVYGDSLKHVNMLLDLQFGVESRRVPSHMPHFIDRHVLSEAQARWPDHFDVTSSHRFRHSRDMQFALAYMYWMMSARRGRTAKEFLKSFDKVGLRGLHSFAFQLNLSAFCGIGGACRGCSRGVRGCQGVSRLFFVSETAPVELKSGRV